MVVVVLYVEGRQILRWQNEIGLNANRSQAGPKFAGLGDVKDERRDLT